MVWHICAKSFAPGIEDLLGEIKLPTLVMPVRDDVTGWRPDEARQTCSVIPDCRVEEIAGTGHISPLLIDRDRIVHLIRELWAEHRSETEHRVANRDS